MPEPDGYKDWTGLAQAIKAAATKAAGDGASALDVNAQIVQAQHDRFLSRVFAEGEESEWLLKGGTAMLARVPKSRSTKDLDLASTGPIWLLLVLGWLEKRPGWLDRAALCALGCPGWVDLGASECPNDCPN